MKSIFVAFLTLSVFPAFAEDKPPVYKNWKTFHSDYGYEFKYPDCWLPKASYADDTEPTSSTSKELMVEEQSECRRNSLNPPFANSISFSSGWEKAKNDAEIKNMFDLQEKNSIADIQRKDILGFKRIKVGSHEATIVVRNLTSSKVPSLRWEMELYCTSFLVRVVGPEIQNPTKSYYEKLKSGDLALPEPEKSIYGSLRCVKQNSKR
jgi:hypothetical protein